MNVFSSSPWGLAQRSSTQNSGEGREKRHLGMSKSCLANMKPACPHVSSCCGQGQPTWHRRGCGMKQGLCDGRSHLGWWSSALGCGPFRSTLGAVRNGTQKPLSAPFLSAGGCSDILPNGSHQSGTAWGLFFLSFPSLVLGVSSSSLSHSDTTVLKCQGGAA